MRLHRLLAQVRAFQRDQGGQTLLSFAIVFPVVLVMVFGSAVLLQIIWLKFMLSSGVYDAVQHITYTGGNTRYERWQSDFVNDTKRVIWERVPNGTPFMASLAPGATSSDAIEVTLTAPERADGRQYPCDGATTADTLRPQTLRFNVTAKLTVGPLTAIPPLSNIGAFDIFEEASGYVDCPRWVVPETIRREKCVFAGFFPGLCPDNN